MTVWISLDNLYKEAVDAEVARFTAETGVTVNLVSNIGGEFEMLERLAELDTDDWPDAVFAHEYMGRALADTNRLVRPEDCDPGFRERVLPAARAANTVDGVLAAAPVWASTQLVYYDAAKLAAAGIETSQSASFDDVLSWAEQAVSAGAAEHGLMLSAGCGELLGQHLLAAHGGAALPDNGRGVRGARLTMRSDEVAALAADLAALRVGLTDGSVMNLEADSTGFADLLAVADRTISGAVAIHTSSSLGPVLTAVDTAYPWVDAQVVPFSGGLVGTTGLWMFGSDAPGRSSPAWSLVDWLTQPAAAARLAAAAGFVPAVQGATDEPALAATWSEEPRLSVPRDAIAEATDSVFSTTYLVGPWRQVRSAWTRLCEAMTSPDVDLTQAVADMLDEVNNVIDAYEMARIASPVAESSVPIDLEVRCDTGDEVAGVWVQTAISSSGFAEPAGDGHFRFTLDSGGPFVVHVGCGEADGRWLAVGWSPILEGTTGEIVCSGDRSQLPGSCRVA